MIKPRITVLMSCFNSFRFLKDSIESIQGQDFKNFEFLIVDDGSTDDSISIIKEYAARDPRILLIMKNENSGLADSLNIGMKKAKGTWIARQDADDISLPERLSLQLQFMKKNPSISLVGGSCIEIGENGNSIKTHHYPPDHESLITRLESMITIFPHSSAFFNRGKILDLGGYNQRYTRAQDTDLWFRIGESARMASIKSPVLKLRRHSGMISHSGQGRLQQIMGLASIVCHFRRLWGISDPSRMEAPVWQKFLKWVEKKMDENHHMQIMQLRSNVKSIYRGSTGGNPFRSVLKSFNRMPRPGEAGKILYHFFFRKRLALNLAKESHFLDF